jgi:CubicO group peptidase (beta-lactamase class C family)
VRQPTVVDLADRLARRHVGVVLGTLDLASDRTEIEGRGRVRRHDGSTPGPDTLFEIGSITKTFTSLALAVLVESGTVRLDTPVRDLLPAGTAVPSRDGTEITLEHLARHTSGLPRSPNSFVKDLWVAGIRGQNPYDVDEATVLDSLSRTRHFGTLLARAMAATPTWAAGCWASRSAGPPAPGTTTR